MATYARLDRAAIESLGQRFGVGDIATFSIMDGGLENTSYYVTTSSGAAYVLTLWDQKSRQQANNLAHLLAYLVGQGFCTSSIVATPQGGLTLLHDEKPVMLKQFVEGDVTADMSGTLLIQLGQEMARLHLIPAPPYLPRSFPYGRSHFFEVTESSLGHRYLSWLAQKVTYLDEHIPDDLPRALIHGDLFFDNVIVDGDELRAIIDLEEACDYYRLFDLGMALIGTCRDGVGICFEKAGLLVRGYQTVTRLQPIERGALKAVAVYAAVATSFWRFRQYHVNRPQPEFDNKHVEMQEVADLISDYSEQRFTELCL